jgi:hypothetical protein
MAGQQYYVGKVQGLQQIDVSSFAPGLYNINPEMGKAERFIKTK